MGTIKKNQFKKKCVLFILIIFFIMAGNVYHTYAYINFKNITIENGINQGTVETMLQDAKGYIWLGTNDGLNRYNGDEFKVYDYNEEKNSIGSNYINDIAQDNYANIWVATVDGMDKIDAKTQKITNYNKENNNISAENITGVITSKDDKIIVSSIDGIHLYNAEKDIFERILEGRIISEFIYSIFEDDKGNIWIGTDVGVSKISKDLKNVKNYSVDFGNNTNVYNVLVDKNGQNIWIGSGDSGLIKMDLKTETMKLYKHDIDDKNSIPNYAIGGILEDKNGTIWLGTGNGLVSYNENEDNFNVYTNKIYDKNSLVNNDIKSLMEDEDGNIWVGTYSGISIFNPDNVIKNYRAGLDDNYFLSENIVHGIYEDDDGYLWVGSNSKGVSIIDRKNEKSITLNTTNTKEIKSDAINDITGVKETIYIATDKGLVKINKNDKSIKVYNKEDGLIGDNIKDILIDSKGYIWIGTTDGLSILNPKDDSVIDINDKIKNNSTSNLYIRHIYEDSEGEYYIGLLREQGLCRINPKQKKIYRYENIKNDKTSLSNNSVRYINGDDYGNIWIGTTYGLNKFNKNSEEFTRYTTDNGLSNNTIYGILVDDKNNIWISTNKGINKLNQNVECMQQLNTKDGLQGNEFNGNASFKSKSGEFFFGGVNGLNSFYPEEISKTKENTKVEFDEFSINGDNYFDINNMKLASDTKNITIKFFNPSYLLSNNIRYEYILEGGSGKVSHTDDNQVVYDELKPGKYTFKVRAVNSQKEYENNKYSEVSFEIKPPVWLSKPAIVIYIILIILSILNEKNKLKVLDKRVQNKTARLREEMEKNNELLNKNIRLEQNKNAYFVNLSHELRTPLNVIYSTNQLIDGLTSKSEYIKKEDLERYMNISQRNCKRLLNLINNIIDSTKLQNNMYLINLEEVDIVYLVEEAALGLSEYIKSKGIDLIIDPQVEEKIIRCDKNEIERCIVNLVSNAYKFTPEGGQIIVHIKDNQDEVMIIVEDTGIGIDEKHHKVIFDRFSQVVDLNNEVKGGSGLGLTITNNIVKLHNGHISVESKVGEGSKFTINLPLNLDVPNRSQYNVDSNIEQI